MVDDRFTVRLPEDLAEWVHRETDERERPKAWVIAEAVRTAKGDDNTCTPDDAPDADLEEQMAALEDRLDALGRKRVRHTLRRVEASSKQG